MTTNSNVNLTDSQLLSVVNDPLTGQTLAPISHEQNVSQTPVFSQVLAEEQQTVTGNVVGNSTQQLASMMDGDIRRLRLDIAHEIKTHVMKGDRESLKDAQERYNQCTTELRKRAGILEGTTAITTVPLGAITTSVPLPSTENVFPEGNPLQLLYQTPYANQPSLYQNQPAGISPFSSSNSLITPDQLNNPQVLVTPLYNQDLNQLQQSNAQQLQMLQLQLQQGMPGFGGEQQNNSISF